jgi:hypothetical protein
VGEAACRQSCSLATAVLVSPVTCYVTANAICETVRVSWPQYFGETYCLDLETEVNQPEDYSVPHVMEPAEPGASY